MIDESGRFVREDPMDYLRRNLAPKDEATECVNWIGQKNDRGYGVFSNKLMGERMGFQKATAASRAAWVLHNGRDLASDEWVLHTCDNPACCNPDHLYVGTPQQNVDDMVLRERNSRGEDRPAAKLKEEDIREIRRMRFEQKPRAKIKDMAEYFGVSHHTIKHVVYEKSWSHVH